MRATLVVLLGLASGCGDGPIAPSSPPLESRIPAVADERSRISDRFVGTYELTLVNGEVLPYVFVDVPNPLDLKQEVVGGTLEMGEDDRYLFVSEFRDTRAGEVTLYSDETFGGFGTTGFDVDFVEDGSGYTFAGDLRGTVLTFDYRGFSLSFTKVTRR